MEETIVVGISGRKQSGKTTLCNYLLARELIRYWEDRLKQPDSLSPYFNDDGSIDFHVYDAHYVVADGKIFSADKSTQRLVPVDIHAISVKVYSFADALKQQVCVDLLGLSEEQVNGTDDQKNSYTRYKWDTIPRYIRQQYGTLGLARVGPMTAREVMQVVGTDVFRRMFADDIWVRAAFRNIENDIGRGRLAVISDVRFVSEVESILNHGGYIIRLLRSVDCDKHPSEAELDAYQWDLHGDRVLVLDNRSLTVHDKNELAASFIDRILPKE